MHWTGTLDSTPLERIEREIEINLLGVVRTAHAVMPQIVERRGYLLNVASLAAASHAPMMSAYSASKAGVEAFSNSLRAELAGSGARVGCAYFGVIETDMVRDAYANPAVERAKAVMPGFVAKSARWNAPSTRSRTASCSARRASGRRAGWAGAAAARASSSP